MRQRRKLAVILLLAVLFVQAAGYMQVYAASATLRFSVGDGGAVAEQEFTVTLSV